MSPTTDIVRFLEHYYAEMETNDPQRYGAFYAEDVSLRFGNAPTLSGRAAVVSAFEEVLGRVASLHHDLVNVWEQDGGVVVFESVATWRLFDSTELSINACSVFTIVDDLFTDLRIYVDNAPLFAELDRVRA